MIGSNLNTSTMSHRIEPSKPVISQIAFTFNFMYMAVLVSGAQNGVLVFDWKQKNKPSWFEWYNPADNMSPGVNMSKADRFA